MIKSGPHEGIVFEKHENYREFHEKITELEKNLSEQKHDYEI